MLGCTFPVSFLTFQCHPSAWLLLRGTIQVEDIPHANREGSVNPCNTGKTLLGWQVLGLPLQATLRSVGGEKAKGYKAPELVVFLVEDQ